LQIARSKAFDAYRGKQVWPADGVGLEPFVRDTAETLYHPVGTCSVGTVVDEQLRVRGVDGLRVIDGSVMRSIVTGHPNAGIVAIAERGAELISR
jgi:choline dehydrogenase